MILIPLTHKVNFSANGDWTLVLPNGLKDIKLGHNVVFEGPGPKVDPEQEGEDKHEDTETIGKINSRFSGILTAGAPGLNRTE